MYRAPAKAAEICGILLLAAFEQVLSDIEDQGGNREDADQSKGEDREDLTAIAAPVSC